MKIEKTFEYYCNALFEIKEKQLTYNHLIIIIDTNTLTAM